MSPGRFAGFAGSGDFEGYEIIPQENLPRMALIRGGIRFGGFFLLSALSAHPASQALYLRFLLDPDGSFPMATQRASC